MPFIANATQHPNPFSKFGTGTGDKREGKDQDAKFERGLKRIRGQGSVDSSKQEAVVGLSDKERCQLDETKQCCGSPPKNSTMPLLPKSKPANEKSEHTISILHGTSSQLQNRNCPSHHQRGMLDCKFSTNNRVDTSRTFCGGRMAFVCSNDIKMGDICIFELAHKLEFQVFILQVGKDRPEKQSQKLSTNRTDIGFAASSHNIESFCKKSRKNSLKFRAKLIQNVEVCDKQGSKKSQATGFSHRIRKYGNTTKQESPTHSGKNAEGELGSQGVASVRTMAALTEGKIAKLFTFGFPNFVRVMRKFSISGSYTLKIPPQFSSAHLPNCKTGVVLRNIQGGCWTVNSVPDLKGRAVHNFCRGWMAFVHDNDVKIGDTCMFELVGKCEMGVCISGVGLEASFDHKDGKSLPEDLPLEPFSSYCHAL